MKIRLPEAWQQFLGDELQKPYISQLEDFLTSEEKKGKTILPPLENRFSAFELTPPERVRVVVIGQDPYPTPGQAHGLAFSVQPGVALPRSLKNIFQEISQDAGCSQPSSGHLLSWAEQGVLLLNTVLTVNAGESGSHAGKGWEQLTDRVIQKLAEDPRPKVFLLWGKPAQKKGPLIDETKHLILKAAHPSPLSARYGFFGCRHFSQTNAWLEAKGLPTINWQL